MVQYQLYILTSSTNKVIPAYSTLTSYCTAFRSSCKGEGNSYSTFPTLHCIFLVIVVEGFWIYDFQLELFLRPNCEDHFLGVSYSRMFLPVLYKFFFIFEELRKSFRMYLYLMYNFLSFKFQFW